jgi:hypothetical protein
MSGNIRFSYLFKYQDNTVLHQSKSASMDVGVSAYEKLG